MIKLYNAGECGAEYSDVIFRKVSPTRTATSTVLEIMRSSGSRDVMLNAEQVLKLYEALGEFIKNEGITHYQPKLIEGDSI